MSRIALLGGSFNPPHLGHQMIALWVLSADQADQVWLVPSARHPFGKELEAFEHRVRMCELAAGCFAAGAVQVSRVEQELGQENRTYFTVRHVLAEHPEHRFRLIIGADILQEKDEWYRFDDIARMVDILVVGRRGYPPPEGDAPELPDISSSGVRERIRTGQPLGSRVPAKVAAYIGAHGLYRDVT